MTGPTEGEARRPVTAPAHTGRITVQVEVDTDDLRQWANWHADRGHHGAAHILYKAASDGEALTDQALREARAMAWDQGHRDVCNDCCCRPDGNPYRDSPPARQGGDA